MTPEQKSLELINMYYNHSKSQKEAIGICNEVVLKTICQKIDSLHSHVSIKRDYDEALIMSSINQLKYWQEVAYYLQKAELKLPV